MTNIREIVIIMDKKSVVRGGQMEKKYSIQEVFDLIGEENLMLQSETGKRFKENKDIIVDGYKIRPISLRYMTFYQKGTTCVCCGRKGAYFKLEGGDAKSDPLRKHFNLYSEDNVLITKDHIIAKSKGGKDMIENMQTMCTICNVKKGNS